jgi:parallel beta-helix repeat protein
MKKRVWSSCENHSRIFRGTQKRGMSAIVAVVLIVLITVVAVGIIWGLVLPVINEGFSAQEYDIDLVIDDNAGYTYYDADKKVACVQIKRGADDFNLSRIDVAFYFNGTSYSSNFTGSDVPGPNEARKKCFNLEDYGAPNSIEIASVIWDNGEEIVNKVSSAVAKIKSGSYPGTQNDIDDLDKPEKKNNNGPASAVCEGGCDDENVCTEDACVDGVCSNDAVADGTVCADGGACSSGTCVPVGVVGLSECSSLPLDQSGVTYMLVKDIEAEGSCFVVGADYVTIDFNEFGITGNESGNGVSATDYSDVTIRNGEVTSFDRGIYFKRISDSRVSDMVISNNLNDGIYLFDSSGNTFIDVDSSYNKGSKSDGIQFEVSDYNTLTRVTTNFNGHYGIFFEGRGNRPRHYTAGNRITESTICRNEQLDVNCDINFESSSHVGFGNKFSTKSYHCGSWLDNEAVSCAAEIDINNCQELQDMKNDLYADYYLEDNIDCEGFDFGDGKGFMPIGDEDNPFEGGFDGQFNKISNLRIYRPDEDNVGLFGYADSDGAVRFFGNVQFKNVDITGKDNTGTFIGYLSVNDGAEVSGVAVDGVVTGEDQVGGLFGVIHDHAFENAYSTATVNGNNYVGGIIGSSGDGTSIDSSYSTATVNGNNYVGGIDGSGYSTINSVYSVATVNGVSDVFGVSGAPYVSNSYWYDKAGDDAVDCASQFAFECISEGDYANFFSGYHPVYNYGGDNNFAPEWDFDNMWNWPDGNSYPKIQGFD